MIQRVSGELTRPHCLVARQAASDWATAAIALPVPAQLVSKVSVQQRWIRPASALAPGHRRGARGALSVIERTRSLRRWPRHFESAELADRAVTWLHRAGDRPCVLRRTPRPSHIFPGYRVAQNAAGISRARPARHRTANCPGRALQALKGYGTPEVGRAYDRARELCRQMGESPQLFMVRDGLKALRYPGRFQNSARVGRAEHRPGSPN